MTHGEPTIETVTGSDGYRFLLRRWRPPTAASRARVVMLHGVQSHGGWYGESCRRLAGAGFEVLFLDRRGSGLNQAARGDTPSWRTWLDDLNRAIEPDATADPNCPLVLIGISWGGKLAVAAVLDRPEIWSGLGLLCPGLYPRVGPPLVQKLLIGLARLVAPRAHFPVPLNDPALFTANPARHKFIATDPLALRTATARFLVESVRLDRFVRRRAERLTLPVLLMLAGHDRIIDNGRTRGFYDRIASPAKRCIEYPEAHHTLEFEPRTDQFHADLIAWLTQVCDLAELRRRALQGAPEPPRLESGAGSR